MDKDAFEKNDAVKINESRKFYSTVLCIQTVLNIILTNVIVPKSTYVDAEAFF
jgi:hypothetical protein